MYGEYELFLFIIEVFYIFQVDMLRERNKLYGTIKFVDISSDDYSPEENQGLDYKTVSFAMLKFFYTYNLPFAEWS